MSSNRSSGRNPTRKRRRPAKMNDTWPDEKGASQASLSISTSEMPKRGKTPRGNKKNSKKVATGKVAKKQPKDRKLKKEKAPTKGSKKTPRSTKSSKQTKQQRDAKFREAESRTMALESQAELEYSFGQEPDDEPLEFAEEDNDDPPIKSTELAQSHRESKPVPKRSPAICQPIVYGSIAWWLGRKADEQNSHKWTVFLRGVDCEDLSYLLEKVVFHLHSSFEKPKRVVTRHPFEVTEHGWGEFEVKLQLHFVDPDEPVVEVFHQLRLYPPGSQQPSMKRPVVSEFYDEVVFNRPTDTFTRLLLSPPSSVKVPPHPLRELFTDFSEENDIKAIMAAQNYISHEIDNLQQRLSTLQNLDMGDAAAATAAGFDAAGDPPDEDAMKGNRARGGANRKGAANKGGRRRAGSGRSGF